MLVIIPCLLDLLEQSGLTHRFESETKGSTWQLRSVTDNQWVCCSDRVRDPESVPSHIAHLYSYLSIIIWI